jgi:hypothetical protein
VRRRLVNPNTAAAAAMQSILPESELVSAAVLNGVVHRNAVQCSAAQRSAGRCSAVQSSAVQRSASQRDCSAAQCSVAQCAAMQCGVVWHTSKRPNRTSDTNDPRNGQNGQDREEQVVENGEKGVAGGVDDTAGKGGVVGARCAPRKSDGSFGHAQMHHKALAVASLRQGRSTRVLGTGQVTCLACQETQSKKVVRRVPKEPRKVGPNAKPGDKMREAPGLLTCEGKTLTCEGDTLAQHRCPGQKKGDDVCTTAMSADETRTERQTAGCCRWSSVENLATHVPSASSGPQ